MRIYCKWRPNLVDPYTQWQEALIRNKISNRVMGPIRRAKTFNVPIVERVDPLIVYIRDDNICQICKKPVTTKNRTMDHIIPLNDPNSEHSYKNVQTAHRACNASKGQNKL